VRFAVLDVPRRDPAPIQHLLQPRKERRDIPLNEYDAIYTDSLFRLEEYSPKVEGKHIFALRNAINTDYDYTLGKYIVQAKFYDMFPKNLFYVVEPYDKLVKIAR